MTTDPVTKQRTFLGHPVGLYVLFFTEMWEPLQLLRYAGPADALHGELLPLVA